MDQHKELEVEGQPTDQRKEEKAEAGKPEEPADQRKEEEEREEGDDLKEPTDQRKEDKPDGLTGQRKSEAVAVAVAVDKSEELTDQRKAVVEVEVDKSEELTDQRKEEEAAEERDNETETETERSSGEESMEASSLFAHPCSRLLRYLVRAYAWCMGLADWFGGGTRPSAAPVASLNSSREEAGEAADIRTREISNSKTTDRGFYMREMIVSMWAVRRPRPPGKPREGRGGGGGSHN